MISFDQIRAMLKKGVREEVWYKHPGLISNLVVIILEIVKYDPKYKVYWKHFSGERKEQIRRSALGRTLDFPDPRKQGIKGEGFWAIQGDKLFVVSESYCKGEDFEDRVLVLLSEKEKRQGRLFLALPEHLYLYNPDFNSKNLGKKFLGSPLTVHKLVQAVSSSPK